MATGKVRDYAKLAADIKDAVGESNIVSAAHCATRLRLVLKESPSEATSKKISSMPGVIQVLKNGGQYQIVIGTHAKDVYAELTNLVELDESEAPVTKQSFLNKVIATMSAVFAPFIYVLAAAGILQGALILINLAFPAFAETGTYSILSMISWTPFTFLPIFIAITASKHFKTNTFIAVAAACALVNPDWTAMAQSIQDGGVIDFAGIALAGTTYTSTVLPPLFLVLGLSYVERLWNRVLPEVIAPIFTPLLSLVVMVPATMLAIGPASDMLANSIAAGYNWLVGVAPYLAAIIVGGFWQVFVIFGVHWGITPVCLANYANQGFDTFQAFQTLAVIAQAAACFGVFLIARKKSTKSVALPAGITGIFGITEPAIYGVTLALKKPFIAGCIGGAIGACIVAFFQTVSYVYAGLPGLLTVTNSIGENPMSFPGMMIAVGVTIVVTIVAVRILGIDEGTEAEDEAEVVATEVEMVAPVAGTVIAMEDVSDPIFASKMMGDGVAIQPSEGSVHAPFNGEVVLVQDSKHAYGLRAENGAEILIHIGLDTVHLNGEGFTAHVKPGDKVEAGQKLCDFDTELLKHKGLESVTMLVVTNSDEFEMDIVREGEVQVSDRVLLAKNVEAAEGAPALA